MLERIYDVYWYYLKGLYKYELYLNKYQGYGGKSILEFKRRNNLQWTIVSKILSNLKIIDGLEIRNHIRNIYLENQQLFDDPKTYISQFGPLGKSSGIILNQFLRCYPSKFYKMLPAKDIHTLTEGSNIIFLDDFIGSGQQAIEYIRVIDRTLNGGVKGHLFTIAATEKGLNRVRRFNSRFSIETCILLNNQNSFLLNSESTVFSRQEKDILIELNQKLGFNENNEYQLGIPLSFFYSTPDNSLGLLWEDNKNYTASDNVQKTWYGLTPRHY
jgi:hypothetical protein